MKQEKKKIIISLIVSVILSIVVEAIFVMSQESFLSIDRVLVLVAVLFVAIIHIVLDKGKLYDFIIDNRFKIAGIIFIVTCILGYSFVSFSEESVILGKYNEFSNLKYLEFKNYFNITNENLSQVLYTIFTNFKMLVLILSSYDLCLIISKDRKISVIGSILISFSSYMVMHLNTVIIFGQAALVFADKVLEEKDKARLIINYIGLIISLLCFGLQLELGTIIGFSYIIIALLISFALLLKNEKKLEKKSLIKLIVVILLVSFIIDGYHIYMVSKGVESLNIQTNEENRLNKVFGYGISVIETFKEVEHPENWTGFITIFPVPILISLIYMYKKEKDFEFLFPISLVLVIEVMAASVGITGILGNITGFALVSKDIAALLVSLMNIYLIIYIISNLKDRAVSFNASVYISLAIIVIYYFIGKPVELSSRNIYYFFVMVMVVPSLLLMNYVDKRYKKVFCFLAILLTIMSSITINPITKATYLDFTKHNYNNFVKINEVKVDESSVE